MKKIIIPILIVGIFSSCKSSYSRRQETKLSIAKVLTLPSQNSNDTIGKYFSNIKLILNDSLYLIR
jgi:hypothetical protein